MTVPAYHHGVRVLEVNDGPRPLRPVATSIFGTVCTSSDADADVFPLNTPVLVTDVMTAAGKAGDNGTLPRTLETIGEQSSPVGVVVRVEAGDDQAETDANVIGTIAGGQRTGLQALLQAEAVTGVTPRIIAVPGLDSATVAAAMAVILPKLNAFGYANCAEADTVAEGVSYREGFSARELMLMYGEFTGWSGQAVAAALGLRARLDEEVGWHKSISNVPVAGVTGIDRSISWNLQDPSTDAGILNQAGITTLIRRNGFKFWGSRTCADDTLFQFETAVRTAQILKDTIAEGCMQFVDKPLHPSLARDIIESINATFRGLKAAGFIIDANAWLNEQLNTSDALSSGALQIDYDFTPVPPLENLLLRQRITDRYMADFPNRVAMGR